MKILILSATTGGGHMTAANAVKDYLTKKGEDVKILDTLESVSHILNKTVTETYEYMAKYTPSVLKMVFSSSNKKSGHIMVYLLMKAFAKKILPEIESYDPNIIITTHPFPTEMMGTLKKHNKTRLPIVCIITDYAPHRTWLHPYVDHYIVANGEMIEPMVNLGIDEDKIHNFGIPVNNFFHKKKDKKELRRSLGLNEETPVILIMAGSFGKGSVIKIYEDLQKLKVEFQIVIITGKNEKLYIRMNNLAKGKKQKKFKILPNVLTLSKIFKKTKPWKFKKKSFKRFIKLAFTSSKNQITKPTQIIYFTKEVDKYMHACDLIITKPGGLTVTEALASGLPIAVFSPIPGPEEENTNFLVKNNMAVELKKGKEAANAVEKLLKDTEALNVIKENIKDFDISNCLENIYKLIKFQLSR